MNSVMSEDELDDESYKPSASSSEGEDNSDVDSDKEQSLPDVVRQHLVNAELADDRDDEEKELQKSLNAAAIEMYSEIAGLKERYSAQISDFVENELMDDNDRPGLFGEPRMGFSHTKGHLGGIKTAMKFTPDGYDLCWVTRTKRLGTPRGPTARSIRRWVSRNSEGNYEYWTWCGVLATDKEFQRDIQERMEVNLRKLADSLGYKETEFERRR